LAYTHPLEMQLVGDKALCYHPWALHTQEVDLAAALLLIKSKNYKG